jgi:AcrR family transcriptional regulator
MATDLCATKGSFYWHFADIAALRSAMLAAWEEVATRRLSALVDASGLDGAGKLALLIRLVAVEPPADLGGAGIEPAIRAWARTDAQARAVQTRVDHQRLQDLAGWFAQTGDPRPEASAQALYAAILGLESLRLTTGTDMAAVLADTLARLLQPPINAGSNG